MPLAMKAAQATPGDSELVERMRASDPDALRAIVERYQDRIFALIFGIVRDRHEVEDVAQEVFMKVFTRIDAFDGRSRFYTWLYRVAANTAKDHVKKRARRPAVALDEESRVESPGRGPFESAERAEARRKVREAIDELPLPYREVLALRELDGLSYNEIAAVLRVSLGTVESRLHRARSRLKEVLGNDE